MILTVMYISPRSGPDGENTLLDQIARVRKDHAVIAGDVSS